MPITLPFHRLVIIACSVFLFVGTIGVSTGNPLESVADPPVQRQSSQPFITVGTNGDFLLSWIEPGVKARHAFRFASFDGRTWSKPITIAEGNDFFVNWADVPSLVQTSSGQLAAHWLQKSGSSSYAYDVNIRLSVNNGASWSAPIVPHSDRTKTEHGFVSLFELPDGNTGLVWLDGREMAGSASHDGHGEAGSMTLRAGVITHERTVRESLVDPRVCECCPTAAVRTRNGIVVAYRDRSPQEVRNIHIVRYENGAWTESRPVHDDGWIIPGCPVNGPALSSIGDSVAIAWFTAPEGMAQVNVAFSTDGGMSFAKPIRVDGGAPLGRVAINLLPGGAALVMWLEQSNDDAEIRLRLVQPSGKTSPHSVLATVSADRKSGYPRLARSEEKILFAWVDTKAEKVRTRLASLKEIVVDAGKTR